MKVITPGHKYELKNHESAVHPRSPVQTLQFVEKTPVAPGSSELRLVNDGTTNEDILAVLIDRIRHLNAKFPCRENSIVLTKLEESLLWLNHRTDERKARGIEGSATA